MNFSIRNFFAVALCLGALPSSGLEPFPRPSLEADAWVSSLGPTDFLEGSDRSEASWELQFSSYRPIPWPRRWPAPHPLAGVLATSDGAVYPYVGLSVWLPLSSRVWFAPSVAVGAYLHGHGRDLGSPLEFRSRAEIVYRLSPTKRLGLSFSHLSNSGLSRRNPGTETLSVSFYSLLRPRASRHE